MRLNYARLIHDSWKIASENKKLKLLAFFPAFAAIIVFTIKLVWQIELLSQELGFSEHNAIYKQILGGVSFLSEHHLLTWGIFLGIFILLFQFAFPAWINSSLILGIRQKIDFPEKYLSSRQIIANGFRYFPLLVELKAVLAPFSLMSVILYGVMLFRFYHGDLFSKVFLPILIGFFIFSLLVNIFTAFAEFFIVCEDRPIMTSIKDSIGFVFTHFEVAVSLLFVMLLVNVRVLINVLVILGIPIGLFAIISWLAKSTWLGIAVGGLAIIAFVLFSLTAYLTAILDVFSTSLWMKAFLVIRDKEKADSPPPPPASTL